MDEGGMPQPTKRRLVASFRGARQAQAAMPYLFSYGTLQQEDVQLSPFGGKLLLVESCSARQISSWDTSLGNLK